MKIYCKPLRRNFRTSFRTSRRPTELNRAEELDRAARFSDRAAGHMLLEDGVWEIRPLEMEMETNRAPLPPRNLPHGAALPRINQIIPLSNQLLKKLSRGLLGKSALIHQHPSESFLHVGGHPFGISGDEDGPTLV